MLRSTSSSQLLHRRGGSVAVLAAGIALVVAACGGDDDAAQTTTSTSPPASQQTTTQAPTTSSQATTTTTEQPAEVLTLTITDPANGDVVGSEWYTFRGETTPGAAVSAGRYPADVAADGTWAILLRLDPGPNIATFVATDASNASITRQVTVTFDPGDDPVAPPPSPP
jgi:ABC-type glycerol-3-phosphate transport system substrate-binding protein